jgi:hypothetical protein
MKLPNARFDFLSLRSCCLELRATEAATPFGHATGFLWRYEGRSIVVTNWHVLAGKNPFTGEWLKHGQCPQFIDLHFWSLDRVEADGTRHLTSHCAKVCVYEHFHSPRWREHAARRKLCIDIAVIDVTETLQSICSLDAVMYLNEYGFSPILQIIGADAFAVGYPINDPPPKMPIWKRGSIASEPLAPWRGRPAFLLDGRTSAGMSGSPVIRRVVGPCPVSAEELNVNAILTSEFLGVYSGRLHDDEDNASIGIVWRREALAELLTLQMPGSRDAPSPPTP